MAKKQRYGPGFKYHPRYALQSRPLRRSVYQFRVRLTSEQKQSMDRRWGNAVLLLLAYKPSKHSATIIVIFNKVTGTTQRYFWFISSNPSDYWHRCQWNFNLKPPIGCDDWMEAINNINPVSQMGPLKPTVKDWDATII